MDSSSRAGAKLQRNQLSGAAKQLAADLLNSTALSSKKALNSSALISKKALNSSTLNSSALNSNTQQDSTMSLRAKWTLGGIIAGSAAAGLLGAGSSALALYFARRVLTPARVRVADQEVLAVIRDGGRPQVILAATPDTTLDGVYSLFFDGGNGHARIGRIVSYSPAERTVLREVEAVYQGHLETARRGWWSGAVYPDPSAVGLAFEDVHIEVEGGTAPAWLIPAEPGAETWAIMVHGRGATRQEGLRAARVAHELGLPSLVVSYRNDGLAPSAPDGRYGLGSTEWRDIDSAIAFALAGGAREVVLFGWSMGGAICLQTADLSKHRHVIRAMVLDAPVIDWVNVLAHHAELNRIPSAVGRYGQLMMGHRLGRRLTGLAAPVDLKSMDWVSRAVELRTPTLILHSVDDEYVPYRPSALLAEKNPEMVTFEAFEQARHTKEWNVDPVRWESLVKAWLQQQLAPRLNPGQAGPGQSNPGTEPGQEPGAEQEPLD
jgi:pimeloyl-ACP methyl ester carboxylesterase